MKRLCIIPCGSRKIWDTDPAAAGPYAARFVYTGALHRKCRAYAELFVPEWVILSAKHGFLLPDDEVQGNYNVAFGTNHPDIIPPAELRRQVGEKGLNRYDEIVVLGGKKFKGIVPQLFPDKPIAYPLEGSKGIGHMLQRLDQAVQLKQELAGG